MKDPEQYIRECQEWIARHTAELDQLEKRWQDQYPLRHPFDNQRRMHDLEARRFTIKVHQWELEEFIKSLEEE